MQLFENEINNSIPDNNNNISSFNVNDDIYSSNNKKYYKQISISESINNKKIIDKESINLYKPDDSKKKYSSSSSLYINIENKNFNNNVKNNEIKSLSRNHNLQKKNKLDFYFKDLASSSTSSLSTLSSPAPASSSTNIFKMNKNDDENNSNKQSDKSFSLSKNKRKINDDDEIVNKSRNPFILNKKKRIEENENKNNNEEKSFNNVLLKFESNNKQNKNKLLNNDISKNKQKQKKQVSILSLFSQNEKKECNIDGEMNVYNSLIDSLSKQKKSASNFKSLQKSSSNNNTKIRIKTRQNKLSTTINDFNYIEPSVYVLTCDRKENSNYLNYKNNYTYKKRNYKTNMIFNCHKVLNSFHPIQNELNNKINETDHHDIEINLSINDTYDLMKSNLIKKKNNNSLVDSFITSFEKKNNNNDKKNIKCSNLDWKRYFQNSIENSF